ncbi:MAG TPA: hypothetical protein VK085_08240 [Pseudogracilibacillus sp.]|nr:hypothetical protein [Pseudogracilibacillus sp.]
MPSTTVMMSIGMLFISFLVGFIFYYILSEESKDRKKKQLDHVLSLLINFIIFIWVGKILLNMKTFFQDPLAILAYPSNNGAFYIAFVLTMFYIAYQIHRKKLDGIDLFTTFVPIFAAASFIFEFFQLVVEENHYAWKPLILWMILLFAYLLLQGRIRQVQLNLLIFTSWGIGQLILYVINVNPSIFGYVVTPLFYVILILGSTVTVYSYKRKVL